MSTEARREMQETERDRVEGKRCRVAVCAAAGCLSNGGQAVRETLERMVKEKGASEDVDVFGTGCLGLCDAGPLVQVQAEGETRLYERVDPTTAARIATEDAVSGTPAKDLLKSTSLDPVKAGPGSIQPGGAARRPRIATAWLGGCSGCHMSFRLHRERGSQSAAARRPRAR